MKNSANGLKAAPKSHPDRNPHLPRLEHGPVTLYAQLATILRDRILTGAWKYGDEIPSLDELVEEFSVARVTARQAVQILVDESLLSSQRGRRTYVTFEAPQADANPLYSSTGSITSNGSNYSIDIISRQEFDGLPAQFTGPGKPAGRYMRIRKVDSHDGVPYAISDNYVSFPIFSRFPANAERKIKLSRLVRDYARPKLAHGREVIKVATLSYEEATRLQTAIGSAAAFVTRVFISAGDSVAYFGQFYYRADRFAVERDITDVLVK
jgi:GntR family transcriptional regulator